MNTNIKKTDRQKLVANEWAEYYANRGDLVTGATAIEKRKDADGFYPYLVIVYLKGGFLYRFDYYTKH